MKEVIAVYVNKEFKQLLKKSEVRFLIPMCNDFGKVTIELVKISLENYKIEFGL